MDQETRQKIEETVKDILSKSNMEEMTEFKARVTASERLGIDLSDLSYRKFIRELVESFLLSTVEENGDGEEPISKPEEEKAKEIVTVKKEIEGDGDRLICKLADMTNVTVHDFRGRSYVSVREFYVKNGKELPSATDIIFFFFQLTNENHGKQETCHNLILFMLYSASVPNAVLSTYISRFPTPGVTMAIETWSALKDSFPAIDEAIAKMQSKLRTKPDGQQNGDMSNSGTNVCHEFSPIETTRFDGKNYHCWAEQMELFLKQLQIAYVLTDRCPSLNLSPEVTSEEPAQAKVAEKKWLNDDYLCRHCILNSLSDNLYYQFSKKAKTAKELWEELKLVYLYEEFGTKRAQVRKYIEFQIVDGRSIVEQILELNGISNSIIASGIMVDENFHVSAIISKLPPSWKDFCIKLMREEHLSFWMLMDRVRVEELYRHRVKQAEHSKSASFHPADNLDPRIKDTKKPGVPWKRREPEIHSKPLICNYCGRNGHVSRFCRDRRCGKIVNGKQNGDNSTTPAVAEVNTIDSDV